MAKKKCGGGKKEMTVYTNQPIPEEMRSIISLPKEISEDEPKRRGRPAKEVEPESKTDAQTTLQRNHKWATDLATHFDALILIHEKGELVLDRDGIRKAINLNNYDSFDSAKDALAAAGY